MNKKIKYLLIAFLILTIWSVLPFRMMGFAPHYSIAFFAGFMFKDKKKTAFIIPLCALLLKDLLYQGLYHMGLSPVWGFYGIDQFVNYAFFMFITLLGLYANQNKKVVFLLLNVGGTTLYFIISNFYVWRTVPMYAGVQNFAGLILCYVAAWPFYYKAILASLTFTSIFLIMYNLNFKYVQNKIKVT